MGDLNFITLTEVKICLGNEPGRRPFRKKIDAGPADSDKKEAGIPASLFPDQVSSVSM